MLFYIVLFFLGLSYLNPNSFSPWPNFFQDSSAILALILLSVVNIYNKNIKINKFILGFFIIILFIILCQFFFGLLCFRQEFYLSLLFISIFLLSIINGLNFDKLKELSFFFVTIGVISVFIQIIQWLNIYDSLFFLKANYYRTYANLGQPNNLATLLFICFLSNIYLYINTVKFKKIYNFIGLFFLLGIAMTQSRTSWIVFFLLLVIVYFKKNSKLFIILKNYACFFIVFILIIPYLNIYYHGKGLTVIERLGSDYSRLDIWKQMIFSVASQPWFGYGWNQSSAAQTKISLEHPFSMWIEYSHNIFLDILVWVGVPFGGIIILMILSWLSIIFFRLKEDNDLIFFLIIIAFFVHCMLELPFAYAYFLIPIGFYVGVLTRKFFINNLIEIKYFNFILIGAVCIISLFILRDYLNFSKKQEEYSSKYLLGRLIAPSDSLKILDALDLKNDIQYLDECYIIKNRNFKDIREVFYRYPSNKNVVAYYKTSIYYREKNALYFMLWKYPNFNKNIINSNKC